MKTGAMKNSGYSLVEVIVAAGIFAMVITGGIAGVRMGFQIVDNSRHYTRISQILQSEVESLRSLSWKEIKQLPSSTTVDINPHFSTNAYDAYVVSRNIYTESALLRRVEVTVSYTTRSGKPASLKYFTFFTSGGVNDYYYRTI
jgi:Tfp pilus assembly protein PilV